MYKEYLPPTELRDWLNCFWTLSAGPETGFRPIYPDGCADIIFNFGHPVVNRSGEAEVVNSNAAFVVGTMTCPLYSKAAGQAELLGIRFRPGVLFLFTGVPQAEFVDKSLALDEIRKDLGSVVQSLALLQESQRIDWLSGWLLARLAGITAAEKRRVAFLQSVLSGYGPSKVKDLARTAGYSVRQMERIFLNYTGVRPKEYLLISRFVHLKEALHAGYAAPLLELAEASGFHDHAHLTHVFRRFAGVAPSLFCR